MKPAGVKWYEKRVVHEARPRPRKPAAKHRAARPANRSAAFALRDRTSGPGDMNMRPERPPAAAPSWPAKGGSQLFCRSIRSDYYGVTGKHSKGCAGPLIAAAFDAGKNTPRNTAPCFARRQSARRKRGELLRFRAGAGSAAFSSFVVVVHYANARGIRESGFTNRKTGIQHFAVNPGIYASQRFAPAIVLRVAGGNSCGRRRTSPG